MTRSAVGVSGKTLRAKWSGGGGGGASDLPAELNGHLEAAVADRAGAYDLALVRDRVVPGPEDLDAALAADRERLAEQERHAAERRVAGEDVVRPGDGVNRVQDGERRLALEGLAGVSSSVGGRGE